MSVPVKEDEQVILNYFEPEKFEDFCFHYQVCTKHLRVVIREGNITYCAIRLNDCEVTDDITSLLAYFYYTNIVSNLSFSECLDLAKRQLSE